MAMNWCQISIEGTYEQERAGGFTSFIGYALFSDNQTKTTIPQRQDESLDERKQDILGVTNHILL